MDDLQKKNTKNGEKYMFMHVGHWELFLGFMKLVFYKLSSKGEFKYTIQHQYSFKFSSIQLVKPQFSCSVRKICPQKVAGQKWHEIVELAEGHDRQEHLI